MATASTSSPGAATPMAFSASPLSRVASKSHQIHSPPETPGSISLFKRVWRLIGWLTPRQTKSPTPPPATTMSPANDLTTGTVPTSVPAPVPSSDAAPVSGKSPEPLSLTSAPVTENKMQTGPECAYDSKTPAAPPRPLPSSTPSSDLPSQSSRPSPIQQLPTDVFFSQVLDLAFNVEVLTVEEASAQAADAIDAACPSFSEDDESAEGQARNDGRQKAISDYVFTLWTTMLSTVWHLSDSSDASARKQDIIVDVIHKLRSRQKGVLKTWTGMSFLWTDLPMFEARIVDTSPSPVSVARDAPDEGEVRMWRNQNGFMARCFDSGLASWEYPALRALRSGLEGQKKKDGGHEQGDEDETMDGEIEEAKDLSTADLECEILAATEWLIHAGRTLHRWAQETDEDVANGDYDFSQELPGGPLFDGRPGLSIARWNLWKQRLEKLLQQQPQAEETRADSQHDPANPVVLSAEVCAAMNDALRRMRQVEENTTDETDEIDET